MDWLILVLVTPLIIVVVVMLYGFVGCTPFGESVIPAAPTNLRVTGVDTEHIDLSWDSNSPANTEKFELENRTLSPPPTHNIDAHPGLPPTYSDLVGEGAFYTYRVRALAHDGTPSDFSNDAWATTFLKAPSDFSATPVGTTEIRLDWTNHSEKANSLKLERSLDGIKYDLLVSLSAKDATYSDKDIRQTKYYYRLTAYLLTAQGVVQAKSGTVDASATIILAWKTSFETSIDSDGGGWYAGSCNVQIIEGYAPDKIASLQESGNWVRITMFGTLNSDSPQKAYLTAVYISRVRPGSKPYDSADDIKQVFFGGKKDVDLSQNKGPVVSDPIRYDLDRGQDLIIAFDTTIDSTNIYFGSPQGPRLYAKKPAANGLPAEEASMKIRSGDYVGPEGKVNCILKTEVA